MLGVIHKVSTCSLWWGTEGSELAGSWDPKENTAMAPGLSFCLTCSRRVAEEASVPGTPTAANKERWLITGKGTAYQDRPPWDNDGCVLDKRHRKACGSAGKGQQGNASQSYGGTQPCTWQSRPSAEQWPAKCRWGLQVPAPSHDMATTRKNKAVGLWNAQHPGHFSQSHEDFCFTQE